MTPVSMTAHARGWCETGVGGVRQTGGVRQAALSLALRDAAHSADTAVLFRVYIVPDLDPSGMRFAGVVTLKSEAIRLVGPTHTLAS